MVNMNPNQGFAVAIAVLLFQIMNVTQSRQFRSHIVNRGEWLGSSANIKGGNKDAKVHDRAQSFVLRSYTMHELRNQHVSIG